MTYDEAAVGTERVSHAGDEDVLVVGVVSVTYVMTEVEVPDVEVTVSKELVVCTGRGMGLVAR